MKIRIKASSPKAVVVKKTIRPKGYSVAELADLGVKYNKIDLASNIWKNNKPFK